MLYHDTQSRVIAFRYLLMILKNLKIKIRTLAPNTPKSKPANEKLPAACAEPISRTSPNNQRPSDEPIIPMMIFINRPMSLFMTCSAIQPIKAPTIIAEIQPIFFSSMSSLYTKKLKSIHDFKKRKMIYKR
ncbi:unknown [Pasteurella multocida subsp. multocida str. Pm70]|uniref:Uncharacterized protein PM1655 n=1 Tax=Pasteurella multocida (strain Pm70) TaxID=272843 RepID=Y1655_PASMU|nr:RecName: Full=Uncharacterized protein PM1655 [Pasteurella multocida subsp. multocida str. Pm70]AAK03739.1 unknown [Pasteurella multocida subsp. multocida str. Pm70]